MNNKKLIEYISTNISEFHKKRIEKMKKSLNIKELIKRKNPYLFKAKGIVTCEEYIRALSEAFLSSQEETLFGDFLEELAIFVCRETYGGYKSGITGIDLEFEKGGIRWIVDIKSGSNHNSSQLKKMEDNFKEAKKVIKQKTNIQVEAVRGCCYGKNSNNYNGIYYKYFGQDFWGFLSGDEGFYLRIIEPLGIKAKVKSDEFNIEYGKLINQLTIEFSKNYCLDDMSIDWKKIVNENSMRK
ncbi:MAG: hypothetical protein LBC71_02675 [Oscillospiraceae bacterium]|jgi:hypothetical protein|nr:hypothetical protein [Oscillospiraceae bacterium]